MTDTNPANPYPAVRHGADIHNTGRRDDIRTVRELGAEVDAALRSLHVAIVANGTADTDTWGPAIRALERAVDRLASWDDYTIDVARCSASARALVARWRRDGVLPARGDR